MFVSRRMQEARSQNESGIRATPFTELAMWPAGSRHAGPFDEEGAQEDEKEGACRPDDNLDARLDKEAAADNDLPPEQAGCGHEPPLKLEEARAEAAGAAPPSGHSRPEPLPHGESSLLPAMIKVQQMKMDRWLLLTAQPHPLEQCQWAVAESHSWVREGHAVSVMRKKELSWVEGRHVY